MQFQSAKRAWRIENSSGNLVTTIKMQLKLIRFFLFSSGVLLLITAIAKLVSAFGNAHILETIEPVFGTTFHILFLRIGALELCVALICLFSKNIVWRSGLVAYLASGFVFYRFAMLWIGYHKPCSCMGNFTDALHISPQAADTIMKVVLVYLLTGSYATLFWLWRQRNAVSVTFISDTSKKSQVP